MTRARCAGCWPIPAEIDRILESGRREGPRHRRAGDGEVKRRVGFVR